MFSRFLISLSLTATIPAFAEEFHAPMQQAQFKPFTGRITGNKVRLRVKPSLDAPVVKTLRSGDLFIVSGESEEFFSVPPTAETRAYVHRKFLIDGAVDGSRVNVRLAPHTDAPVVAQLNTGDKVEGKISAEDPKWLEVTPPEFVQFYVARDYVENIGGPEVLLRLQKKTARVNRLLNEAKKGIAEEMAKSFEQIDLDEYIQDLSEVSQESSDFPSQATEAKQLLRDTNDLYLQRKIKHLESLAKHSRDSWNRKSEELKQEISKQSEAVEKLHTKYSAAEQKPSYPQSFTPQTKTPEMLSWEPKEQKHYESWVRGQKSKASMEEFYQQQDHLGKTLRGVVTPYTQSVRGRPGDYVLLNERTKTPVAYLYSTKVKLADYVGQNATLRVVERSNRHFAFPAYFVLYAEQ